MNKENLIGTWKCTRTVEKGIEKTYKKPKVSITFLADGSGKFKAMFIPLSFRWTLENDTLNMFNTTNGQKMDAEIKVQENCIVMDANGSVSYFYR